MTCGRPNIVPPKLTGAPPPLRLKVTSDPANLSPVRRACEGFCRDCGLSETSVGEVGLCVNEAMANVTRHAYGGATDKPVAVTADWDSSAGSVRITVRDWGIGVTPGSFPAPSRDPLTPGGLGMVCLKQLMDEIVYTPQPDGMLLVMTKKKVKS